MKSELVEEFSRRYAFPLDPFQQSALDALGRGESVLVAAPTGSGKTVVGEFAVWLAMQESGKAFYTTPLKALSNQKFGDLIAEHGSESVGLLTGDNSIQSSAPIVVMTTEVLRNMIYERSDLLADLRYVVLDEVHYLQDRYRGAVWEEVIIHLPIDVKIVCLSATVSNAEEFADWIQTLRGPTTAIIEEKRPVTLNQHYLVEGKLFPMFVRAGEESAPNPEIRKMEVRLGRTDVKRGRQHRAPRRFPKRSDLIEQLKDEEMLPAIYFIFSRKGCNAAVVQCLREGIRLTDETERSRIRDYAEMRTTHLDQSDLEVLGYQEWLESLINGVSAHHAGLIPVFKETVEELFQAGLVKAVFATETLSLGINMPARSVVIESLSKFTGEKHEMLTPGEFTQLTGRAGRRGIDVIGHAIVPRQPDIPFGQIAGLASKRTYPLVSSFNPSYNMATNLVRNYSREDAEHLLNSSFAQYRADKDVVVLEKLIERNEGYMASYHEKMVCDRGDFTEYFEIRRQIDSVARSQRKWQVSVGKREARSVFSTTRPGQVLLLPGQRGPVVILEKDKTRRGEARIIAMNSGGRILRFSASSVERPPRLLGEIPFFKEGRNAGTQQRKRMREFLHAIDVNGSAEEIESAHLEKPEDRSAAHQEMLRHPCHICPDRDKHSQWAERADRLARENDNLKKRVQTRTQTLSRRFERVLEVLEDLGYVSEFTLTSKGEKLARIYNENDLVTCEALVKGYFAELTPSELASVVSTLVYESRGPFESPGELPTATTKRAFGRIVRLAQRIQNAETRAGVELTRGADAGIAQIIFDWAEGSELEDILDDDMAAGDFIRACKQTSDLLEQMSEVADEKELCHTIKAAVNFVNRGVVAYTGTI